LARPVDEIENVAQTLAGAAREQLAAGALDAMVHVDVRACESEIGSGALPTRTLASRALVISASSEHQDAPSAADMTAWLRALPTPIIARVRDRAVWMDCRTLFDAADVIAQLPDLMAAIAARARVA
jgi:L-seryl-tRNA(Ser) seleniumtransferase